MKRTDAFIPARGGSVGVPGKNIRILSGKPLIKHTIDFAIGSELFRNILVSTDSSLIAELSTGGELSQSKFESLPEGEIFPISKNLLLHKRKSEQAQTLSPIRDVLFELATGSTQLSDSEHLIMLQPTSPFRTKRELEEIFEITETCESWSSLASVTSVGGAHPDRMYRNTKNGVLQPYLSQNGGDNKPRQLLEDLVIKDGAYYVLKSENLRNRIMLGDEMISYFREGLRTANIDTETDFRMAELISANKASWNVEEKSF